MAETELPIPTFTLLPPRDPDNPNEPPIYDCSLCDLDVFNVSIHAWSDHGVKQFEMNHQETPREYGVVGAACGINGCIFDGNHQGRHSWEPTDSITESAQPQQGVVPEVEEEDSGSPHFSN